MNFDPFNRLFTAKVTTCFTVIFIAVFCGYSPNEVHAQTSTEFWFAPPEVTSGHGSGGDPTYLRIAAGDQAATVTISQPANAGFAPITLNVPANTSATQNLTPFLADLETRPANTVLNTGLKIESTAEITCYYEVSTHYNPDIWALKGQNGLGTEFYVPMQNIWRNGNYSPTPYSSFDIVASEDNTTILVYPSSDLDGGQQAFQSFTVVLNAGQTYSGSVTSTNPANNPTGTVLLSDKPISVSIKDDSIWPQPAGCKDLAGDQIVPVDIVGTDYIVNKGGLTVPENAFVVATANNTVISVDGVPQATLFNGETYQVPITNALTYISGSKPVYLIHISGFGCESGMALLPPLNCAGSEQVSFVRSSSEAFFMNLLVPAGAEDAFVLNGDASAIDPTDFSVVPGTGGAWMGAQIQFNNTIIPQGAANLITNTEEVFSLGLINGGGGTGCRFGYFSQFSAEIVVDAGAPMTVCANQETQLSGSVSGGATQGIWTTDGTGSFQDDTDLGTIYEPSLADLSAGGVTLTLTSVGNCFPVEDQVDITYTPAPIVDAGADIASCANNTTVTLNGFIDVATGGLWSGGSGTYNPGPGTLNATYTPSAAEVSNGSVQLTLTSTGNGTCLAESDIVEITFGPSPTANAGGDVSVCANNANVNLNGSVTNAGGGQWSGGSGLYSPSDQALASTYTPTAAEIANGSLTLTLTTTGNGGCTAVQDQMTITFTDGPTVDAGSDRSVCKNNADIVLNGSVSNATGATWSGGSGTFSPDENTLNATYSPSLAEILGGGITLTLTSTGNGGCNAETDQVTFTFTDPPTVDAGVDGSVCSNNEQIPLNGSLVGANFGIWSGGNGTFSPNTTTLNAQYTPTAAEISSGNVTLTLTSLDNGNCNPVSDDVTFSFTPAPTADAGADFDVCENNPSIALNGAVTVAGGGQWSGGSGSFSPNNTTLNATYSPTPSEISSGSVTLTLTTTSNGNCNAVADQITISFTGAPTANANADQFACANNPDVTLNGSVTVATGGVWSGGLGSFAPDANTLNATYTPTQTEINSGSMVLTLTTTGNGNCTSVSDDMTITFTPAPTVDAGAPITACANNAQLTLNGTVNGASGGTWSGGSGTFTPNANTLNALYAPTPAEIASGSMVLTLSSTGNGNCLSEQDFVTVSFTEAPAANAGSDVTVCANNPDVNLNGTVNRALGGIWMGGSGTFTPNNTTLGATYTPSAAELSAGTVTLTLHTTGNGNCNSESDQMTITITPAPTVEAGVGYEVCSNNPSISLGGSVVGATGGSWSGGNGTFSPDGSTLNATYVPSQTEINAGTLTLTLTSTGNGNCLAESDDVTFTFGPSPTVDAGENITLCANNAEASLGGSVTVATGGTWSGGGGNFSPNANDLNAYYTPTPEEIAAGTVTLTLTTTGNGGCNPESDDVTLNFTPGPTANAGADQSVCANTAGVVLNGSISIATGGTWSGGTGTFAPNANALDATYTPSAAEISAGSATLTLTTTGNGTCNPEADQMTITITPAPSAEAGIGTELCANNATIALNGSVTGATGGTWSGGNGTFNPDGNTLNASYTPSQSEINGGSITLTLTTTGNGSCAAENDDVTYTFGPAPTADAGPDMTLCANNAQAALNGSVTLATGGTWVGNGTFSPNANTLNATYTPTAAEITAGTATLTLVTTGNGDCNAESDEVKLTFTPGPTANAGTDQTVCANNPDVTLNGSVSIATGGTWSGGSGTFAPDANALGATYTPSATEIAAGTVTLTLTTTGNGDCNPETDQVTIAITPAPTVEAGSGTELCANNATITLGGSVSGATGGIWSGGNGTFNPDGSTLNALYTPSQSEINAGNITLTLTSTGNGSCAAESDDVTYTFSPAPTADAGENMTLCANNAVAALNGSVTVAGGGTWSGGNGTFTPNANTLNATYTPTAAELSNGTVTLTLTTSNNGNCNPESDDIILTFTPGPSANAGTDKTVCANNPEVSLNGSVSIATGGTWSGGSGTFAPDANTLNATYTPSASEIAAGTTTLTLTTTGNGTCSPESDDIVINISPSPVVDAGADLLVCSNNAELDLNGAVSNAGGGKWTGGLGSYAPADTVLDATYTPTLPEIVSGSITFTLTSTDNNGCLEETDQVTVTFTPAPTADAGVDTALCAGSPALQLSGSFTVSNNAQWSGGSGTFSPNPLDMNAVYNPSATDLSNGGVTLTLTTLGNGNCNAVSDDIEITYDPEPTVNAGSNLVSCANDPNVVLQGNYTNADGVEWSGGTGFFNPSDEDPNATYTPSNAEIINGGVTLTLTTFGTGECADVSDQMNITINPSPVVDAGQDVETCANNNTTTLNGSITFASGGQWSGGNGVFTPGNTALGATYQPTPAEISAGFVTLTLTSTGNGNCLPETDQMTITYTPGPMADAGPDDSYCENNAEISLSGSFNVADGAAWSGGAGSFNPDNTTPTATYTPSPSELNNGSVTLTLTTFGNGNCLPASDQVTYTFTPAPEVDAGEDYYACVDDLTVPLAGSVSGSTATGQWTTDGTGVFVPNSGDLNGSYLVSSQDSLVGEVTLTLTSTGNGNCLAEADQMTVYISPAGTANAGPDQDICANNTNVYLDGTIGGAAAEGVWTTSGSGIFLPNAQTVDATYVPSSQDVDDGQTILTFSVNSCNQASDDMTVTFTPAPEVQAGDDITVCSSETDIQLNGFVFGAGTTGSWTTTGTGTFSPDVTALNAVYEFSPEDVAAQTVYLVLTSTNVGNCIPVSDTLRLNIYNQGTANAGVDVTACDNNPELQLEPTISGGDQVLWTSTGTGTFAPNDTTLNATYVPSEGDLVNGSVSLALTIVNSCNNASDFLNLSFVPGPTANAGVDQAVCGDVEPFQVTGTIENAGGGQWSTLGSGTFQNANSLNTFYVASQQDIDQGGTRLVLTTVDNGNCFGSSDTLRLYISTGIVVDAGPDREACAQSGQIDLFGSVSQESSGGIWTTSGTGGFSPSATALNGVYNFTEGDIAAGSVTLTLTSTGNGICEEQSDEFILTFGNSAYVYAGEDVETCETTDLIELNGVVSGDANQGEWTSSGSGTFFPSPASLNAYYEPSNADLAAGNVVLTLTSTNSSLCEEGVDALSIVFQSVPDVDAGADAVICGEISSVQMLGSVAHADGGVWTSTGTGVFMPNDSMLTAVYMPSEADSIAGGATLTLTSYGNGLCSQGSDQMELSFADAVSVNAGADIEVCESSGVVPLNGLVQGSGSPEWSSSGTGTFSPSPNQTAANYTPSEDDLAGGTITLYLYASGNGNCPASVDSLKLSFDPLPVIDVSDIWATCTTSPSVDLTSDVFNADQILWSSTNGGSFDTDPAAENTTYTPTASEVISGSTTVMLSATSDGPCGTVNREVTLNFMSPATVDAGTDIVACASEPGVALDGSVSGTTTTGIWSTNSFGSFAPHENQLDAQYVFGDNDLLVGFAKLILTSLDNGPCEAVSDTVSITINPVPIAEAGEDLYVCKTAGTVAINGHVENEELFSWTTFGDGVFLPSNTEVDPEYVIGNNDVATGSVDLELTVLGLEGCADAIDTVTVYVNNPLSAGFAHSGGCTGSPVTFTDGTEVFNGEIAGWEWDFGGGNVTNLQNPQFTFGDPGSFSVSLVVESSLGCTDTISDIVNIANSPDAAFDMNANPAPSGFNIQFNDHSTGAYEWAWDFGDGTGTSNISNPRYAYDEGGEYTVSLVVFGGEGCMDSTATVVVVEGEVVLPPRLPNTFSPNDDGLNDIYLVRGGPFTSLDFRVYDGWGRELFQSSDQASGWDGTDKGKQMPTGVYVYTVKATNNDGETFDFSGQINLLR